VDVAEGLKRVGGNKRLYRDLLRQFAAKQADAAAQITTALDSNDLAVAERIAHTVKGVAANLGITAVSAAAAELEKTIRHGTGSTPAALETFRVELRSQTAAIREKLGEEAGEENDKPARPFNADRAVAAIKHMRHLLDASDGTALDAMPELTDAVSGKARSSDLKSLQEAIDEFEFERAMEKLNAIEQECELSGEVAL
jgi:HPt (histidine-containing phosphotransfer) domain-containing protein